MARTFSKTIYYLNTASPYHQRGETSRAPQSQDRSGEEHRRRGDAAALHQGLEVGAGDPRRYALSFFDLGMQEYEAFPVLAKELGYRDVLDGGCGGNPPLFFGCNGLLRGGHGGGSFCPVVRA